MAAAAVVKRSRNGWWCWLGRRIRWLWRVMTQQPKRTFLECVEQQEAILLGLWDTFSALKTFENELTKRIGTSRFVIANEMIWDAMIAKRDLLTIHFASWIRG